MTTYTYCNRCRGRRELSNPRPLALPGLKGIRGECPLGHVVAAGVTRDTASGPCSSIAPKSASSPNRWHYRDLEQDDWPADELAAAVRVMRDIANREGVSMPAYGFVEEIDSLADAKGAEVFDQTERCFGWSGPHDGDQVIYLVAGWGVKQAAETAAHEMVHVLHMRREGGFIPFEDRAEAEREANAIAPTWASRAMGWVQ